MTRDDELTQVQADLDALKRQMRQLLEAVTAVQEHAHTAREAQRQARLRGASGGPSFDPVEPAPTPFQRPSPRDAGARGAEWRGTEAGPSTGAALGPIYAENARLVDLVRVQAEELGALRERVRQLEEARRRECEPFVGSLRILLQALRPDT